MGKSIKSLLFAALSCAALSAFAITEKWDVETTSIESHAVTAYLGETIRLQATLLSGGKKIPSLSNAAEFLWQTNGMNTAWWTTNAFVNASVVSVDVVPEMIPMGKKISYFFLVKDANGGGNYRVNGTISFLGSPYGDPHYIQPPVSFLDFSKIVVYNAPYYTTNQADEASAIISSNMTRTVVTRKYVEDLGFNVSISSNEAVAISARAVTNDVAAWALKPNPAPVSMTGEAVVWTNNSVRTRDGRKTITASTFGINDYANVSNHAEIAYVGIRATNDFRRISVSVPWGDVSGAPTFATETWVTEKGYATESVTNGLAEQDWVIGRGYVTESVTNGLATVSALEGVRGTASEAKAIAQSAESGLETKMSVGGGLFLGPVEFKYGATFSDLPVSVGSTSSFDGNMTVNADIALVNKDGHGKWRYTQEGGWDAPWNAEVQGWKIESGPPLYLKYEGANMWIVYEAGNPTETDYAPPSATTLFSGFWVRTEAPGACEGRALTIGGTNVIDAINAVSGSIASAAPNYNNVSNAAMLAATPADATNAAAAVVVRDVPSWARAENKPSYTATEIGAVDTNLLVSATNAITAASIGALPATGGTVSGALTVEYEDPSWQSTGVINVGSGGNIGAVINVRGNGEQITLRSGGWEEQARITLGDRVVATSNDVENIVASHPRLVALTGDVVETANLGANLLTAGGVTNAVDEFAANHAAPVASSGAIAWSANPVSVTLATGASLSCTGEWPYSKPVFVRVTPNGTYSPAENLRLIGYGGWPTNVYQAVVWRANSTYYVNVIVED